MGPFGILIRHQLNPGFFTKLEFVGFIWTARAEQSAKVGSSGYFFDICLVAVMGWHAPQSVPNLADGALDEKACCGHI
jgi:hypothetical protein